MDIDFDSITEYQRYKLIQSGNKKSPFLKKGLLLSLNHGERGRGQGRTRKSSAAFQAAAADAVQHHGVAFQREAVVLGDLLLALFDVRIREFDHFAAVRPSSWAFPNA
ncbi:hypothetical protein [Lactiplantibacillus plantarum]|uniref:hypothetical protein n=1 Tax=Lactiplantibacillus plantarum TaxID=1590 RepID=UPI004045C013